MILDTLKEAPPPFKGAEIHTLTNGFRIIMKEDHSIPVVSIQAWARCGAIDEDPRIYGISHGLEHMVFKGTPTQTAGQISKSIEAQGGVINAATQLETTHYYIEVPSYGAEVALDVLSDTIKNPTFPQEELEREKLVILEEIHRRDDTPEASLWDEFSSQIFKNTPYETKVIGNEKTVSAMSREDLESYFKKHYVPSKQTFVVVGDFDKPKFLNKLKNTFGGMEPTPAPPNPEIKLSEWNPVNKTLKKPVQLTYIGMGFPTVGLGHKDAVALDILSNILSGGTSSRLYQKLREEKQVALNLSCDYIPFQQKGVFSFFMDTIPKNSNKAVDELLFQLKKIKNNPIRQEELNRAKARTKSDWLFGSETPRGQASTLGSLSVLGRIDLISNYLNRIEAFTIEDIMNIYSRYLENQKYCITKVEPDTK